MCIFFWWTNVTHDMNGSGGRLCCMAYKGCSCITTNLGPHRAQTWLVWCIHLFWYAHDKDKHGKRSKWVLLTNWKLPLLGLIPAWYPLEGHPKNPVPTLCVTYQSLLRCPLKTYHLYSLPGILEPGDCSIWEGMPNFTWFYLSAGCWSAIYK